MVTVLFSLIPVGGQEADRVSFPAHLLLFGTAKADVANNLLRIQDRAYKLDSLKFEAIEEPQP